MANMSQKKKYFLDQRPQRQILRLSARNYSAPGFYFVTICTTAKTQWLGDIVNNEICLSPTGKIALSVWESLPQRFPGLNLDTFVIMPNHVHGIILLTEYLQYNKVTSTLKPNLSKIIDTYKSAATYFIRRTTDLSDFSWQKSYYDIIMRNNCMLDRTRAYIAKNPSRWIADRFYVKDAPGQ